jgi:hypothetical protein
MVNLKTHDGQGEWLIRWGDMEGWHYFIIIITSWIRRISCSGLQYCVSIVFLVYLCFVFRMVDIYMTVVECGLELFVVRNERKMTVVASSDMPVALFIKARHLF